MLGSFNVALEELEKANTEEERSTQKSVNGTATRDSAVGRGFQSSGGGGWAAAAVGSRGSLEVLCGRMVVKR